MTEPQTRREAIIAAYIQGATDVHTYLTKGGKPPRGAPEFGEAAIDYASSVDISAPLPTSASVQHETVGDEVERLTHVIDRDRYVAAIVLNNLRKVLAGYDWLRGPSRGSHEYDDKTYQTEFGGALDAFEAALGPLARLAIDKADCTTDPEKVAAAQVEGRRRAEALSRATPSAVESA